jgi:hypothetical protein
MIFFYFQKRKKKEGGERAAQTATMVVRRRRREKKRRRVGGLERKRRRKEAGLAGKTRTYSRPARVRTHTSACWGGKEGEEMAKAPLSSHLVVMLPSVVWLGWG